VRLVDATTVRAPGSGGTEWRGHALVDLEDGALCGLDLTDQHGAESLLRQPIEPGEIAVAGRAHARRTDFGELLAHGTDRVVRIGWQNLPLETPTGERLDLVAWMETPIPTPTERPVLVTTPTGTHPLRLIAAPLPPDRAAEARRRCRRAASKKQRPIDRRTLVAAGFILLVTTLDASTGPTTDGLALGGALARRHPPGHSRSGRPLHPPAAPPRPPTPPLRLPTTTTPPGHPRPPLPPHTCPTPGTTLCLSSRLWSVPPTARTG
jgi:hypothetical protein